MTTIFIDDPEVAGPDWLRDDTPAPEQFHLKGTANDHDQSSHAGGGGAGSYRGSAAAETERVAALARRGADPAEFDGPVVHRGIAIAVTPELRQRIDNEMYSTEDPDDFNRQLHLGPIIAEQLLGFEGHQGIARTGGIGQSWTTRRSVAESVQARGDTNLIVIVTARVRQKDIVAQEIEGPDGRTKFVDADGNELQTSRGQPGPGRETDMVSGEMEVRIHGQSPLEIVDIEVRGRSVWGDDEGYGAGADELRRLWPDYELSAERTGVAKVTIRRFGEKLPTTTEGALMTRQFHLQGQHNQKDHGRRYGATKALSEPDGGFTLAASDLKPMKSGWAVAIAGSDKLMLASDAFTDGEPSPYLIRLTRGRIEAARAAVAPDDTALALGGWHNPADGKVEVNVTIVFPQADRARAEQFAAANDQISMANLEAIAAGDWDNAIVKTGGTGGDRDLKPED